MKYGGLLLLVLLTGCAGVKQSDDTTQTADEDAVVNGLDGNVYSGGSYDPGSSADTNDPAYQGDFYDNATYGKNVQGGPDAPAKDRVIYFAFDSASLDSRSLPIIQAHAHYLTSHTNASVLLQGHTDSRGSRSYNIALGERRAISVKQRLQDLGVSASQLQVISYGEERPAVDGYSESAYQRNRRVVINYR